MEVEITPDEDFYKNPWFPRPKDAKWLKSVRGLSPLEGTTICTYGPWVYEKAHGNRPEIHPSELYWWREAASGSLFLMLLQDDSDRFDRPNNYRPRSSKPWSGCPRSAKFRIAFDADPADGPLVFELKELYAKNVVTEANDGAAHD